MNTALVEGFSKFSDDQKMLIASAYSASPDEFVRTLQSHRHPDKQLQNRYAEFTENAVSNYFLPYSLVPNFLIDGRDYIIPMVTDESSVVAAAASAAKFWKPLGGFVTKVKQRIKPGHVHFLFFDDPRILEAFIQTQLPALYASVEKIEYAMHKRGGGIRSIQLINQTDKLKNYYKLEVLFDTADAMGANFINSCLESIADRLAEECRRHLTGKLEIIMSVLSNYTPECIVRCSVSCRIRDLEGISAGIEGDTFARKFENAVLIAYHDISRAVTHNKGIFNGIDAVVLATGNDFRAVEADGHAWAAKDGSYRSLSKVDISDDMFQFTLELPLVLGVVGGLTNLHPMAKASLQLIGNPDSSALMSIASSVGMANHFSAIRSLITGGIQQGHMKLHLINLLNQYGATAEEKEEATAYFRSRKITPAEVRQFVHLRRHK